MKEKMQLALSLIDGAYNIVELWKAETPYQIQWKKEWLKKAKTLIDGLVEDMNNK